VVAPACVGLWLLVFCKVGSALLFGIDDLVARVRAFPGLVVNHQASSDYKNWSILPLALGKAFRAETPRSFALLHTTVLVAGTASVLRVVARRRPGVASGALVGFFATMVPSWLLYSAGSYDQLLAVLLLTVTVVDRRSAACVAGVLLGLTHAEVGAVAVLGLALLSAVDVGPRLPMRVWALTGIMAARAALTVWFRAVGQTDDRVSFATEFGVRTPLGFLADTWPVVVWSAAAGGWVIIARALVRPGTPRVRMALAAALILNLGATAITADQSRVMMLTTMPLVVALAAFGLGRDQGPIDAALAGTSHRDALVVGLLAPLTISWVGEIAIAGDPFHLAW
jgi:hypothetical protein